jgi:beta-galactosidase
VGPGTLRFDRASGRLASLHRDDRPIVTSGPALQLWRAATDNDGIRAWGGAGKPLARWLAWGLQDLSVETLRCEVSRRRDALHVDIAQRATTGAGQRVEHAQRWEVRADGALRMLHQIRVPEALADLPRVGVRLHLAEGTDRLRWLGRGPHESYSDRKQGAHLGVHHGSVAQQWVPYVLPQENGNKTDVRWLSLAGDQAGLRVESRRPFEFSVHHATAQEIFAARHVHELSRRADVVLNLDARQCGVGSASVGPETPARHRVGPGRHRLELRLRAFGREDPAAP